MSSHNPTDVSRNNHTAAAETFFDRACSQFETEIAALYLFGSTARGEASGLASDVDILVVLADDVAQEETADALRAIAYDVMLEYGPVVELHVLSEDEFEHARSYGNPFIENVIHEGHAYA
jgi:predicted nucleotidyltransferase